MITFDYNIHRVVGFADILVNGNANIQVVGICDESNNFISLTDKEKTEMFPPKGRVFAHNFSQSNYGFKNCIVSLMCIPNEKEGDYLDQFIWDKSQSVYEYGRRITALKGQITNDGENNYNVFVENDLIESDKDKLVYSAHRIYNIKAKSSNRIINYWNDSSLDVVIVQGRKYLMNSSDLPDFDGAIDLTSDDQLIVWYINNILKAKWKEIKEEENLKTVEPYIKEVLSSLKNLDSSIMVSRMTRLKSINMNFLLSYDELKHIAETPWLKNSVEKSVEKYKESFFKELLADQEKELEELKLNHQIALASAKEEAQKQLEDVTNEVNAHIAEFKKQEKEFEERAVDKALEVAIKDEEIEKKQIEIDALQALLDKAEERKGSLIADFSIIKDVLGLSRSNQVQQNSISQPIQASKEFTTSEVNAADTPSPMFQAFKKCVNDTFKKNGIPTDSASTISEQFAFYDILLVPNVAIAKALVLATKKCRYLLEYVSAAWKSFNDLWENGLCSVVRKAFDNPDELYILILQNVNMTYMPNYMQPLVDLMAGICDTFPSVDYGFPKNLRIICTVTDDEVMPLSKQCLKYIGCVNKEVFDKEFYGITNLVDESNIGYLSPKMLDEAKSNLNNIDNYYKQYIDEQ